MAAPLNRGMLGPYLSAPVAQLDRALASEARGREFESRRAHQFPQTRFSS